MEACENLKGKIETPSPLYVFSKESNLVRVRRKPEICLTSDHKSPGDEQSTKIAFLGILRTRAEFDAMKKTHNGFGDFCLLREF